MDESQNASAGRAAGLRIHRSNRTELLLEQLAASIARPAPGQGPLASERILLENPSLGPWLNLQLALDQGIAANIHYQLLEGFFWDLARSVLAVSIPARTPLNKEEMRWRLLALLEQPELLQQPFMRPVKDYLGSEETTLQALKRLQLASHMADLFDQYLVYRPDWVVAWDRDERPGKSDSNGLWDNNERWQRALWRAMTHSSQEPQAHRARVHLRLRQQLGAATAPSLTFARLAVFGVTAMASGHLELLMLLARHIPVDLYVLDPCEEYWYDVRGERRIMHLQQQGGRSELVEIGNPLLAAQGRQVQDFLNLLLLAEDAHLEPAQIEVLDAHRDPLKIGDDTLLTRIQQDMLRLNYRGEFAQFEQLEGTPRALPLDATGRSNVHIHSCHSPLREVEVLHDQLLALFASHADLKPRDVVVMMPRVAPYAALIRAVFESAAEAQRIPYHISDRSLQDSSTLLNSFQTLLQLPESRVTLSEVLALLEVPAIQRRFELTRESYEQLRSWLVASGARWGLDHRHRERELGLDYGEFSWRFGLDRLLAGYAMQPAADAQPLGVEPLDEIEGSKAQLLERFLMFWEHCTTLRQRLQEPRPPAEWHALLLELLESFYLADEDEQADLSALRSGLEQLQLATSEQWYEGAISLPLVRSSLDQILSTSSERRHPWSEGVKFCSLLPMRGVPFAVVYLLGMNLEDYPRRLDRPSFDLLRDDYRPGDRSARIDDRWLFLEALLSARRAFHVSYCGQDPRSNEAREPSVLVSELIDYVREGYACADWFHGRSLKPNTAFFSQHPLQPHSADYFKDHGPGGDQRQAYSQQTFAIACARQQAQASAPLIDGDRHWRQLQQQAATMHMAPPCYELSVDDFVGYFKNPPRWFFNTLNTRLNRADLTVTDEELFALERGLPRWQARHRFLELLDSGTGIDTAAAREALRAEFSAQARWPIGQGADEELQQLASLPEEYLHPP
ncbi:MAG: exodeoxyribonuclease V subunit gamma, partial [Xanthomonadales bacterium]|nr:exodeoxyribonuclease V subunit gamma [Xanthomonadales bacterium]